MSATTEAIGQLRASYEKLDREAKSKQVEMERFTNEALARHKAETGEIGESDEVHGRSLGRENEEGERLPIPLRIYLATTRTISRHLFE
jgi:hypothetical protein